jgi:hypothetical protein
MLTPADEWHVHQTPEPIAVAGTDRNFYDRSYFGGWSADGETMFAAAFGIYPHLNIADAHLAIVRGGVQHCLHASKILHSDRASLEVGPVSIEIVEPLRVLRLRVRSTDGLGAEVTFTGRHFPIEEPRFIHRFGPRSFMDYTRLSQACRVSGSLTLDGSELLLGEGAGGLRDRSWGIRPIGLADPQPPAPLKAPQFSWLWCPAPLGDRTLFWHANEDRDGVAWNTRGEICPDGAGPDGLIHAQGEIDLELAPGTRWVRRATLSLAPRSGPAVNVAYEPLMHLEMQGIGYRHPQWSHGVFRLKELDVAREDITLAGADPAAPHRWHRQLLCRVRAVAEDGGALAGEWLGVLEHLFIGEHRPLGLA